MHRNFLILSMVKSESCSVLSDCLQPNGLYNPWNFLGQNTRVDSLFHLQGIFPTQGLNPGLPHCKWILSQLSHTGCQENHKEKCLTPGSSVHGIFQASVLELVAISFSRRSSRTRDRTLVFCIAGRRFII